MNIEVTKRVKIREVKNCMCHNYYYLIHGKIYNDNKTRYRRFKFIIWFDVFDLQEFYEKDRISKKEILIYVNESSACYIDLIKSYDDCFDFYEMCNESIKNYNK
jgi:hypothetical protein